MGPQNSTIENDGNNNTNPDFNCKVKLNSICFPNNNIKVLQKVWGNEINSNIFTSNTKRFSF